MLLAVNVEVFRSLLSGPNSCLQVAKIHGHVHLIDYIGSKFVI